jgi:uncharacterized delta-60 repeat protein
MYKLVWPLAAVAGLAACGDNADSTPDAGPDGGPDGPPAFTLPTPIAVPLSAAGPDQLQSVTAAPGGRFYAAGYAGAALTGPRPIVVVKLGPSGLDPTFGTAGIATTAVEFRGGSDEVDIATQPSGKIIVATTVANTAIPDDRDVAVLRLDADGTLDAGFGVAGVRVLDLSTGTNTGGVISATDASRALAIDDAGRIYVHAVSRGVGTATGGGPRTDTDFTVVRLTADGALDTAWGTQGVFRLDIQESNATVRGIAALADGSVVAGGYANSPGVGSVQPVLYKITPAGARDTAWATSGLFHEAVLAVQTEVYGFVVRDGKIVTGGYGRNAGSTNDYVSMRFDLATGARDLTWGGANGAVLVDPSGAMLGSNCRSIVALPNGRYAMFGSTGPASLPAQDAALVILGPDGRVDSTTYGDGIHVLPLGSNGNDQLWSAAVSGSAAAFVGYKGGGATPTATSNDDSYALVLPL